MVETARGVRLAKEKASKKIDGAVALVMAVWVSQRAGSGKVRKNTMEHTAYGPPLSATRVTANNPLGLDLSPGSPYRDTDVDYDDW